MMFRHALWLYILVVCALDASNAKQFVNEWAIEFHPSPTESFLSQAQHFAIEQELVLLGEIENVEGTYHYMRLSDCIDHSTLENPLHCLRRRQSIEHKSQLVDSFEAHPHVKWVQQQHILVRHRRDGLDRMVGRIPVPVEPHNNENYFSDPKFRDQWHLHSTDRQDLRVQSLWEKGVTGKGVVVTVVDDGIEHTHPDLKRQYDPKASYDLNDMDDDPFPRESDPINKHGTRCSGQIAAEENNNVCGVGVAYHASIGGIRMIDGDVTDVMEAKALGFRPQHIDIYSNSWGPDDDGRTVESPGPLCQAALKQGIKEGRGGKGSIYVFAGGNGKRSDNCNCDGYTNSIYTMSIGAIDYQNQWPWYSEPCCATIASAYSSGANPKKYITTVDMKNGCTSAHSGTSAAAPLVAGIFALLLQASPGLHWRDIQHLTIASVRNLEDPHFYSSSAQHSDGWAVNGAGHPFSHQWGFGIIDSEKLVEMSYNWTNVGPQHQFSSPLKLVNQAISGYNGSNEIQSTIIVKDAGNVRFLEHTTVNITITHIQRGDLTVFLTSPSGTVSQLLTKRSYDRSGDGFENWTFMTLFNWGESPIGEWAILVRDGQNKVERGKLVYWTLNLFGTEKECNHKNYCKASDESAPSPTAAPQVVSLGPASNSNKIVDSMYTIATTAEAYATADSQTTSTSHSLATDIQQESEVQMLHSSAIATSTILLDTELNTQPVSSSSTSTEKVSNVSPTKSVSGTPDVLINDGLEKEDSRVHWIYSLPVKIAATILLIASVAFLGLAIYRGCIAMGWIKRARESTFEGIEFMQLQDDISDFDEDASTFDRRNSFDEEEDFGDN
eukprot:CFRG8440T1